MDFRKSIGLTRSDVELYRVYGYAYDLVVVSFVDFSFFRDWIGRRQYFYHNPCDGCFRLAVCKVLRKAKYLNDKSLFKTVTKKCFFFYFDS